MYNITIYVKIRKTFLESKCCKSSKNFYLIVSDSTKIVRGKNIVERNNADRSKVYIYMYVCVRTCSLKAVSQTALDVQWGSKSKWK